MRSCARGVVSVVLAALGHAATARADPAAAQSHGIVEVELDVSACSSIASDELRRIVGAELGPEVVVVVGRTPERIPEEHASRTDVAVVSVACSGRFARLEVLDPLSGKRLVRHVELARYAARARSRVLGVSIAELLAASWIELSVHPRAGAPAVEARSSERSRGVAREVAEKSFRSPPAYALETAAVVRQASDGRLWAVGGSVAFSRIQWGWLAFGGDLALEGGRANVTLGSVDTLLASAGASLRLRQALDPFRFEIGLGGRIGLVAFDGVPDENAERAPLARRATLPWAGPFAALRAGVALDSRIELSGRFEAGLATLAAEARVLGEPELAIEREWLGLGVGLGFLFDG